MTDDGGARTILVVEDDESITLGLRMNLEAEGYEVEVSSDGEEALARAREGGIDLILLDVMLPRMNGFELVKALRMEGNHVPVVIVTARNAEIEKVMGLELGAEDYITKPFGLAELLARVKAVLRRDAIARGRPGRPGGLRVGDLTIEPATREVRKAGQLVPLTATEFDVLTCLAEAAGRVLTREQIQSRVWGPGHHGTPRTIDNFVLQLRTKLESDPASPRYLLTVRGVGYRCGA